MNSSHPGPEDLLLWQSGELDEAETAALTAHIRGCETCRAQVEGRAAILRKVADVKAEAAGSRFRTAIEAREHSHRYGMLRVPRRTWAGIAAAVLIAVAASTFGPMTVEARAEALLLRTIEKEERSENRRYLLISSGTERCEIDVDRQIHFTKHGPTPRPVLGSRPEDFCARARSHFADVGWPSGDLLSAKAFRKWRENRTERKDVFRELPGALEITTTSFETALRVVAVRLNPDSVRLTNAHFEFTSPSDAANSGDRIAFDVAEIIPSHPAAALESKIAETRPNAASVQSGEPAPLQADPLDEAELAVRRILRERDLDRSVLLTVDRAANDVRVWGAMTDEATRAQLVATLRQVPMTVVQIEPGSAGQVAVPWSIYRGEGMPAAWEHLNERFRGNSAGRQEYINNLDRITLRLAAAARSLDGARVLLARAGKTTEASQILPIVTELQFSVLADRNLLAEQLRPIIGEISSGTKPLSAERARQLYESTHELVFMGSPNRRTPDEVIGSIQDCLR